MTAKSSDGMTDDTKSIITVIVLLLLYPLGLVLMWFWVNWPRWVKVLISLPIILGILGILAVILLIAADPYAQVESAREQDEFQQLKVETNNFEF